MERELQAFLEELLKNVTIIVKTFPAEIGVQANSKAWHNAMQSEHVKRMAIAVHAEGRGAVRFLRSELRVKRAKRHVDGSGTRRICK